MTNEVADSQSKPKGVRQLEAYSENPFIKDMGHISKRKRTEVLYDGKQAVIQRDTGQVQEDQLAIARIKWVEAEQFIKVYTANVAVFFDLSKGGQRVCEFLVSQMGEGQSINSDRLVLYYEDYKEFCKAKDSAGLSQNTFNRGLRELADKALIAKANRQNQWFINPAVMFNGDRARFITEVRRKKKSQAQIAEEHGQMSFIPRPADDKEE